jgi:hypothetical protein
MIAYSTWSNTGQDRYRIVLPTTRYMSKELAKALRMIANNKIEAYCHTTRNETRTGIDKGKFYPAALFFLPSQGKHPEDSFFQEFDGTAIDPTEWIDECTNDLLDEIIAKSKDMDINPDITPATAPGEGYSPTYMQRRIDGAIRQWQATGCVKGAGRRKFYGLAMTFHVIGLELSEMETILYQQAGYASNPNERRSEIPELMKKVSR